jgi:hypothetical protein
MSKQNLFTQIQPTPRINPILHSTCRWEKQLDATALFDVDAIGLVNIVAEGLASVLRKVHSAA